MFFGEGAGGFGLAQLLVVRGEKRELAAGIDLHVHLGKPAPDAEALLRDAGIDPTERPEQLSVVQFAALARAWAGRSDDSSAR